jgi:type IV pilus assembly protein PilO
MQRTGRNILFAGVLVALFGCSYVSIFRPTALQRQSLAKDIELKQKSIARMRQSSAGLEDLEREIDRLQAMVDGFTAHLAKPGDVKSIAGNIEQLAAGNALQGHVVVGSARVLASDYREQPVNVAVSGSFNGLYVFLLKLERLPQLARIAHLSLTKTESGQARAELTLCLLIAPPNRFKTTEKE